MSKRIDVDPARRALLNSIVPDRRSRTERFVDVALLEELTLIG